MPRAAGNDTHYSFYLNASETGACIRLPSVTTILKAVLGASPYMVKWAYNLGVEGGETPEEFRDRRAEEGHETHAFLEAFANGEAPAASTGYEESILSWVKKERPIILGSETIVYSLEHGYAGTLDLLLAGKDSGTPRVVDLKTKKKTIYRAYGPELIQCRAYGMAAQEMGIITTVPDTAILIAKENGRFTYDERSVDGDLWLAVLECYNQLRRNGLVK